MSNYKCANCGAEESIYERVEVTGSGSYAGIVKETNGELTFTRRGNLEHDYDIEAEHEIFACSRCDCTGTLDELVRPFDAPERLTAGDVVAIRDAFGTYRRRITDVLGSGALRRFRLEYEGFKEFRADELQIVEADR